MEGTAQGVQLVLKTSVRASVGVRVLCLPLNHPHRSGSPELMRSLQCSVTGHTPDR